MNRTLRCSSSLPLVRSTFQGAQATARRWLVEYAAGAIDTQGTFALTVKVFRRTPQAPGTPNPAWPLDGRVSFNYGKIEWTYTETDHRTGKPKGDVKADWDCIANKGA